jgi:hypothetical protein
MSRERRASTLGSTRRSRVSRVYFTMFLIHDILMWIRIRGSMPLTIDPNPGSGSCYFRHWPSRCLQKLIFKQFFFLLLFEDTFTSFFKDKKYKRSNKTVGFKVFLNFFACWEKDLDPDLWLMNPDPGGPKTYGSGSGTLVN